MARYTGPKSRIARKFREPIFGPDKALEKKNYPPGQHGLAKKRMKQSEYAVQLQEKQKVKYTYGILERQFSNTFERATRECLMSPIIATLNCSKGFLVSRRMVSISSIACVGCA